VRADRVLQAVDEQGDVVALARAAPAEHGDHPFFGQPGVVEQLVVAGGADAAVRHRPAVRAEGVDRRAQAAQPAAAPRLRREDAAHHLRIDQPLVIGVDHILGAAGAARVGAAEEGLGGGEAGEAEGAGDRVVGGHALEDLQIGLIGLADADVPALVFVQAVVSQE